MSTYRTCNPFTVDVFPSVLVDLFKLKKYRVKGFRLRSVHFDFYQWKHSTAIFCDNHLMALLKILLSKLTQFIILDG